MYLTPEELDEQIALYEEQAHAQWTCPVKDRNRKCAFMLPDGGCYFSKDEQLIMCPVVAQNASVFRQLRALLRIFRSNILNKPKFRWSK